MHSTDPYDELQRDLMIANSDLYQVDNFEDRLKLNDWINQAAAKRSNELYYILGEPSGININRNGYLTWKYIPALLTPDNKNFKQYSLIMIKDSVAEVNFIPSRHIDYLTMGIKMRLSPHVQSKIRKISPSISYTESTCSLMAKCSNPFVIIGQIALVKMLQDNIKDLCTLRTLLEKWSPILSHEWNDYIEKGKFPKVSAALEKYILC